MTDPNDFVFQQIYKGAISVGALEKIAHQKAVLGLEDYKKNRFTKAKDLIQQKIQEAKRESKNERSAAK